MISVTFTVLVYLIINISYAIKIDEQYTEYYYYSRDYEKNSVKLDREANFSSVTFDSASPVKIICHGHNTNSTVYWIKPLVNNYIRIGVNNIVVIEWGKYSNQKYIQEPVIVRKVGEIVGKDLLEMSKQQKIPLSNFHLIGYSLGAHISGFAGKYINKVAETSDKKAILGRITGLDPAGPLYLGKLPANHLTATDASFVDVIHTSAFYGYWLPLGRVDFWINGGLKQPKCLFFSWCNHSKAVKLFTQSLLSKNLVAWQCRSQKSFNNGKCKNNPHTLIGEYVDLNATGNYYFRTETLAGYDCKC